MQCKFLQLIVTSHHDADLVRGLVMFCCSKMLLVPPRGYGIKWHMQCVP